MSQGYYNPQAPPPDGAPPASLGGYRLLELIGRGGMGEVWRAEQEGPGNYRRRAAVKRILPRYQGDPALRARFVAEARINARLEHPNIVQVLSFGDQPEPYLALEYIEGTTVARVLKQCAETQQRIPPAAVLFMVAEAAKGLDYAHRKRDENNQPLGIVHRDVSPQNLLLSVDGVVKVSDFGIARAADNQFRTAAGLQVGKLSYMAPEQVMGQPIDHRADIFSLGVVLWETLLVRPLVPRNDPNAAMQILCAGQFEPPSAVDPRLSPVVDQIVMSALAVNPAQRTSTAGDLAAQLQTLVHAFSPGFDNAELVRVLAAMNPNVPWHHPGGAPKPASLQFSLGGAPAAPQGPPQPAAPPPYGAPPPPDPTSELNPLAMGVPPGRAGPLPPGPAPTPGMAPLSAGFPPPPGGGGPLSGPLNGALPPSGPLGGLAPLPPRDAPSSQADDSRANLPSLDPPKKKPLDRNTLTRWITIGIAFVMVSTALLALVWLIGGRRDPAPIPNDNSNTLLTVDTTSTQQMTTSGTTATPLAQAPSGVSGDYGQRALQALDRVGPQVQDCIRRVRSTADTIQGTVDFSNATGRVVDVSLALGTGVAPQELLFCMRGAISTAAFTPDPGAINVTRVLRAWVIRRGGSGGGGVGGPGTVTPRFPFGNSNR